jgi:acylpyruvate hydrolase
MRLATFLPPGTAAPQPGEIRAGRAVAFGDGSAVLDRLASGAREPATGQSWPLEEVRLLAPIEHPRTILAAGLNYGGHIREMGLQMPEQPLIFAKLPGSAVPPGGPVVCPPIIRQLDYEGELVAVLGPNGSVAGYAVADDVSARDLQASESQWARAKGFDTSCPWGPWITTADEVADPLSLRLRTWVNDELRQDASTADLIFDIPALVAYISETTSLQPGDLLLTGTPSGVGLSFDPPRLLSDGDLVRIEIEGLGTIEHSVTLRCATYQAANPVTR